MENDPVNKSNEEEYQFVDTEHSAEYAPPDNRMGKAMPTKNTNSDSRKRVFIFIGILVALFCLYKLYDVFSSAPAVKPAVVVKPVVAAAKPVPVVVSAAPPQVSDVNNQMDNKIGSLEKVVSQVSQSNANLQDQVAGMAASLIDIQNNISSLSQQVTDLVKPKVVPVVEKVDKTEKNKILKNKAKKITSRKNYYVKAMIQGRAWLMTPDGATLTVSEQDDLPGYGQILSIDPDKAEIQTSSGDMITYRSDDR